jgi:tetratricopeptide (TPR) repeat protein
MKQNDHFLHRTVRIVLASACWIGAPEAAQGADPNTPARSEVLRKQIMEAEIQPLFLSITAVSQMDLDELISNLDRLEIPSAPSKVSSKQPSDSSGAPAAEVEKEKASAPEKKESLAAAEPAETDSASVDPEWLKQIDAVDQPVDPMALGDVLFRIGQLERAERFYQMVIQRTNLPEDLNWQWAMYQRANCLRRSRPSEARALYQELITKAPGSSWNSGATAQQATMDWYESVQETEMKRLIRDPNDVS